MGYKIKKMWKQPHFIVLVRQDKQEMVLVVCKTGASVSDPTSDNTGCFEGCVSCSAISDS